jgi:hypothetical protein
VSENRKAYLLPENVRPFADACLLVYYPDDELYRMSLVSAIEHFTRWTSWERTGNNSGKLAADRWLESFEKTMLGIDNGECVIMSQTDIDCIIEKLCCLEEIMSCCKCCNGQNAGIYDNPPPSDPGNPYIPPGTETTTPDAAFLAWFCAAINRVIDVHIEFLDNAENSADSGITSTIIEQILAYFPAIMKFVSVAANLIVSIVVNIIGVSVVSAAKNALINNRATFVCALYPTRSPAAASAAYMETVNSIGASWGARQVLTGVNWLGDWDKLFTPGSFDIAGYEGSTCACAAEPPPVPSGYVWKPYNFGSIIEDDLGQVPDSQINFNANNIDFSGTIPDGTDYTPSVQMALLAGKAPLAIAVQCIFSDHNANDPIAPQVRYRYKGAAANMIGGQVFIYADDNEPALPLQVRDELEALADFYIDDNDLRAHAEDVGTSAPGDTLYIRNNVLDQPPDDYFQCSFSLWYLVQDTGS